MQKLKMLFWKVSNGRKKRNIFTFRNFSGLFFGVFLVFEPTGFAGVSEGFVKTF